MAKRLTVNMETSNLPLSFNYVQLLLKTFDRNGQLHNQKQQNFQMNPNHEGQLKQFRKEMLTCMESLETRIEKKISKLHKLIDDIAAKS